MYSVCIAACLVADTEQPQQRLLRISVPSLLTLLRSWRRSQSQSKCGHHETPLLLPSWIQGGGKSARAEDAHSHMLKNQQTGTRQVVARSDGRRSFGRFQCFSTAASWLLTFDNQPLQHPTRPHSTGKLRSSITTSDFSFSLYAHHGRGLCHKTALVRIVMTVTTIMRGVASTYRH